MIVIIMMYIFTIGIIVLGLYVYWENYKKSYLSGFQETIGTVANYKVYEEYDEERDVTTKKYADIIEFYVDGKKYERIGSELSEFKPQIGVEEKIMYNPVDPTDNVIKGDKSGLSICMIGIAFLILTFFIHVIILISKM